MQCFQNHELSQLFPALPRNPQPKPLAFDDRAIESQQHPLSHRYDRKNETYTKQTLRWMAHPHTPTAMQDDTPDRHARCVI
jgi:hypothetical protein